MNQESDKSDDYEDRVISPNCSGFFHHPTLSQDDFVPFSSIENKIQGGQHLTGKFDKMHKREHGERDDCIISTRIPQINRAETEEEEGEETCNISCKWVEGMCGEELEWEHEVDVGETETHNERPLPIFEYTCSLSVSTLEDGDWYLQTTSELLDEKEEEGDTITNQKKRIKDKTKTIPDHPEHPKTPKYPDTARHMDEQSDNMIHVREIGCEDASQTERCLRYKDGTVEGFQSSIIAKGRGCSCKTSFEGPNRQLYRLQTLYATGLRPVCICSFKMLVALGSSSGFVHVVKVNPLSRSVRQLDEAGTLIAAFRCFEEEGMESVGIKSISFITQNFLVVGGSNGNCCIFKLIKENRESFSFTGERGYNCVRDKYLRGRKKRRGQRSNTDSNINKNNAEGDNNDNNKNINLINRCYNVLKCATVHLDAPVVTIVPSPLSTTTLYTLTSDKGLYKLDLLTKQVGRVNDPSLPLTSISHLSNSVDKLICATTTGEGIVVNCETLKILHRFKIVKNARRMRVRIYSVDDFVLFHCDDDVIRLFSSITFEKLAKYKSIKFVNRSNGDLVPFVSRVESGRYNVENVFLIVSSMTGNLKVFRPFKYHLPISVFRGRRGKTLRTSVIKLHRKYKIGERLTTLISMESVETEVLDSTKIPFKLEFSTIPDSSCTSTEIKHKSVTAIVKSIKKGKRMVISTRDSRQIVFVASTSNGRIVILLLGIS